MTLNADCPPFECLIRKEYLYDMRRGRGEYEPAVVFGVSAVEGRALGFHAMTHLGAQVARLPISALVAREGAPEIPLAHLELWDALSYEVAVHEFGYLSGRRCRLALPDRSDHDGRYMFTVDFYGNRYADGAGNLGHKSAHIIELDNGCYAAQPNNRILWSDPAFVERPFEVRPDYLLNTHEWSAEQDRNTRWVTRGEAMFYEVSPE